MTPSEIMKELAQKIPAETWGAYRELPPLKRAEVDAALVAFENITAALGTDAGLVFTDLIVQTIKASDELLDKPSSPDQPDKPGTGGTVGDWLGNPL